MGGNNSDYSGGLRIDEWSRIAAHDDALGNLPNLKLNIQGVRLFRDEAHILKHFFLETRLLDGEGIRAGRKGVEVVNSVLVRGSYLFLVGPQIRECDGNSRDDSSVRIGHYSLNRSAVLGVNCGREKNTASQQQRRAAKTFGQ